MLQHLKDVAVVRRENRGNSAAVCCLFVTGLSRICSVRGDPAAFAPSSPTWPVPNLRFA